MKAPAVQSGLAPLGLVVRACTPATGRGRIARRGTTHMGILNFLFKNEGLRQTAAKNTFWIFVSQIGGRIIRAAIVIYAARAIGAADYGVFSYALGVAALVGVIADLGIDTAFLKQSSQYPERFTDYFGTTVALKLAVVALGAAVVVLLGPVISRVPAASALLPLIALTLIFDAFREFGIAVVRTFQKMELEAVINLITNAAIVVLGVTFISIRPTARYLTAGYTIGAGIGMLTAVYLLRQHLHRIRGRFSWPLVTELLRIGLPVALAGILGTLMINTDILLLGWWRTAAEIGYYSAAQRPVTLFYAMLGIIPLVIFPIITKLVRSERERFAEVIRKVMQISAAVNLPIVVGGCLVAAPLMTLLYGSAYLAAVPSFQFLLPTLFANFLIVTFTYTLLAFDKPRTLVWSATIGLISNALFDVILIPRFGGPGSAAATLVNQTLVASFLWWRVHRLKPGPIAPKLSRIALAAVLMGLIAWLLNAQGVNVLVTVALAALVYAGALHLLGEPALTELRSITALVTHPTQREPSV